MSELLFCNIGSGSSGNCYYLGTSNFGILIDVGFNQKRILKSLKDLGLDISNVYGVLLTHGHADHVRGANGLSHNLHLPFYGTSETFFTLTGFRSQYSIPREDYHTIEIYKEFEIGEFKIIAFPLSHDVPTVGYQISYHSKIFTLATDLGVASDFLKESISLSTYLVLEANYDEDMLLKGPYPVLLKQRIMGSEGHLENSVSANLVKDFATDKLKNLFLCHLSSHNNSPEIVESVFQKVVSSNTKMSILARSFPEIWTID